MFIPQVCEPPKAYPGVAELEARAGEEEEEEEEDHLEEMAVRKTRTEEMEG